jgi:large subunit ribosomal protein L13
MISMKTVDADGMVMGRLASVVSKMLLSGDAVNVVNAEKSVIIGNPAATISEYKAKRARGDPYHGPFFPKTPERIFKRTVRGMVPYKTPRGKEAFKRLKVFISIPSELSGAEMTKVEGCENKGEQKSMTLGKLADLL